MPNWCSNNIRITAVSEDAKNELVQLHKKLRKGEKICLFEYFVPAPDYLEKSRDEIPPDAEYKSLHDFRVKNWGTKWDVEITKNDVLDYEILLSRDTAWSPPIAFYEEMEQKGFSVYATYYEPGVGFYGVFSDGEDDERKIPILDEKMSILIEAQNNDSLCYNFKMIDFDKIKMGDLIETSCGNTFIYISHKPNTVSSIKEDYPELQDEVLLEFDGRLDFYNTNDSFFEVEVAFDPGKLEVQTGIVFLDDLSVIHFSNNG